MRQDVGQSWEEEEWVDAATQRATPLPTVWLRRQSRAGRDQRCGALCHRDGTKAVSSQVVAVARMATYGGGHRGRQAPAPGTGLGGASTPVSVNYIRIISISR